MSPSQAVAARARQTVDKSAKEAELAQLVTNIATIDQKIKEVKEKIDNIDPSIRGQKLIDLQKSLKTQKDNLERDRRNEDRKRESAQRALAPLGGGYVKEDSLASFLRQVERKYNQLQGGMAYYHNYYNYYY